MSKYDYLHALYQSLIPLDASTRNKIMREIEDIFRYAEENGKDEATVISELGLADEYAQQFLTLQKETQDSVDSTITLTTEPNIFHSSPIISDTEPIISDIEPINTDINPNISDNDPNISDTKETSLKSETALSSTEDKRESTRYNQVERQRVYTSVSPSPTIHNTNHPIKILGISFGMLLFNAVFILGPFVAVWATIIALVASGFAITISGIAILLSGVLSLPLAFISVPLVILNHPVLLFSFGFLLTGIGGLLTIAMIYLIRFFGYITFKYANWNLSVIRGY